MFRPHYSPSYLLSVPHGQGFDLFVSGIELRETQLNATTAEKHKTICHLGLFSNRMKISLEVGSREKDTSIQKKRKEIFRNRCQGPHSWILVCSGVPTSGGCGETGEEPKGWLLPSNQVNQILAAS